MIGTTDGDLLQRLQWGEYGNGMVEWRGMNMLIIAHDAEGKEIAESSDTDDMQSTAGRLPSAERDAAEDCSQSVHSNARPAEKNTDMPMSRDAVLAKLRCRTEERLQSKATLKRLASSLSRGTSS